MVVAILLSAGIAPQVARAQHVDFVELCRYLGELVGKPAAFVDSPDGIGQFNNHSGRRRELAGPCQVPWKEGMRRMVAARHPEITLPA